MSNPFSELKLDCWDYCFDKSGHDTVWFAATDPNNNGSIVTYTTDNQWRYLFLSDTRDGLLEDIERAKVSMPSLPEVHEVHPVSTQLHAILRYWRLIRYNGRTVCALQARDLYPENPFAWPSGPIAPIRNGFVYTAVRKNNGEILSIPLDLKNHPEAGIESVDLPIASSSASKLINDAGLAGCGPDALIENYHIVVRNVCDLASECPYVYWQGMPFPLMSVISLNPNHSGDPEEDLLNSVS